MAKSIEVKRHSATYMQQPHDSTIYRKVVDAVCIFAVSVLYQKNVIHLPLSHFGTHTCISCELSASIVQCSRRSARKLSAAMTHAFIVNAFLHLTLSRLHCSLAWHFLRSLGINLPVVMEHEQNGEKENFDLYLEFSLSNGYCCRQIANRH